MVDAVDAVNAAVRPVIQLKKDVAIDWKDLTASEVLEHASKGEEVPLDILKWAEDYAKIAEAPEDVTYDASAGVRNRDDINKKDSATATVSSDEAAKDYADETDEKNDGGTEVNLNTQGGIISAESKTTENSVTGTEENSKNSQTETSEISNAANQKSVETQNRTNALKAEYNALVNKIQNNKENVNQADLVRLGVLSSQLSIVVSQGQAALADYDEQIRQINSEFAQYATSISTAEEKGKKAADTGAQLKSENPDEQINEKTIAIENAKSETARDALQNERMENWKFIFDRDYALGIKSADNSSDTLEASKTSSNALKGAQAGTEIASGEISQAKSFVGSTSDSVGVANIDKNIQEKEENKKEKVSPKTQEKTRNNTSANKTDLNGVKDSSLLADEMELQKRRVNRGESPQQNK